jgi:fructose-1,6-bisphosphatase I
LYPRDRKSTDKPEGKLRLLYEAAPMAMVVKEAGGMAITDDGRDILEIEPESLHQRVPLIIGSREDVELAKKYYTP